MKRLLVWLLLLADCSFASDEIPLPLAGLYESPGSIAREKIGADRWRNIPQDVQMRVVKEHDIIELQLLIKVRSPEGSGHTSPFTITNKLWLVKHPAQSRNAESGRVEFDVYKINRRTQRFDDVGAGYCDTSECRFSYVTAKPGHQQRYQSHIIWQPQHGGTEFRQIGDLSVKNAGQSEWVIYKTWENTFKRKKQ